MPSNIRGGTTHLEWSSPGPIATERLERLPDGRVVYAFKHPWRDGTSRVVFSPLELLEKLVALVPKPRRMLGHEQYSPGPGRRLPGVSPKMVP